MRMNLQHVKSVEDKGNHFLVDHEKHGSFRVAKKGLDEKTHAAIQKMADGGEVDEATPTPTPDTSGTIASGQDAALSAVKNPFSTKKAKGYSGEDGSSPSDQVVTDSDPSGLKSAASGVWSGIRAVPGLAASAMFQTPPPQTFGPPSEMAPPATQGVPPALAKPPDEAPAPPTTPTPMQTTSPTDGLVGKIGKAAEAGAQAEEKLGKLKSQEYVDRANMLDAQAKTSAQAYADTQAQKKANFDQQSKLNEDIASGKIDGNSVWNNMTGQKVTGIISLILGGLGGGLQRNGQNSAMDVFDRAQADDIAAQKENLENKHSRLRELMQQGHDIDTSAQILEGMNKNVFASQLDAAAARSGSPQAMLVAQANSAKLRQDGYKEMMDGWGKTQDIKLKDLQIKQAQALDAARPAMMAAHADAAQGRVLPASAKQYLDPELTVDVPGGGVTLASSKEAKKNVDEANAKYEDYDNALKEIEALKGQTAWLPKGTPSRLGAQASQHYTAAAKALREKSGLATTKEEAMTDEAMGNPTSILRTASGTQAIVDQARKSGVLHRASILKNNLIGGEEAALGFQPKKQDGR